MQPSGTSSVASPSSQPTPTALVTRQTRTGQPQSSTVGRAGSLPALPLPPLPSPKSSPAACNCNQTCPSAAAVAGRTTKHGTTTADRACQPVTSISHRSSALGSPPPPLAAAGCCADLPRLPLPGPGWPSRRGGSLGVCASGSVCLVAPDCALHGRRLRAWLAGWLVAFTAGVPPGRGAVDPSVMRWPDWRIDEVICARHVGGPSEVTICQ